MPFWESNIFWGIAGNIGGFIVAFIFFYVGKVKKSLLYRISTSVLITDEINHTPGLKISVGNEPAVDVISTTVTFINGGNQTISSSDFASLSPLQIITSEHFFNAENIDSSYIKTRNKALNPRVYVIEKNRIIIEFEFLKPKQEFEITLLHDGVLSVSGDLKTGVIQSYNSAIKTSKYKTLSKESLNFIFPTLAAMIAICVFSFLPPSRNSINSSSSIGNQVYELQNRIAEMQLRIKDIETENQQLRDIIYSLLADETPSGSIPGPK